MTCARVYAKCVLADLLDGKRVTDARLATALQLLDLELADKERLDLEAAGQQRLSL